MERFYESNKQRKMEIKHVDRLQLNSQDQAIICVACTSVCGVNLYWYRGISEKKKGTIACHEAIGVVESVSVNVTTIKQGAFIFVPFTQDCGYCSASIVGFTGYCLMPSHDSTGYQTEYLKNK